MDKTDSTSKILIALQHVEELGYKKKASLIEAADGDPIRIAESRALTEKVLGREKTEEFYGRLAKIDGIIEEMRVREVHWLTYLDEDYPKMLAGIPDPPHVLFVKGNVSVLNKDCIAVVGSRKATRYGEKVADDFTREFARAGLVVVSGFARGIDSIAHRACVAVGAPTVAVFACGLDIVYPAEHKGLMEAILVNKGAAVSEYPLGTKPKQYHFPERNRIISGLSRAVFLAQAAKKSGSLITMRIANEEQGRGIYVVPGNIYAAEHEGGNDLLRECPHALAITPDDVLNDMGVTRKAAKRQVVELSLLENMIIEALKDGEMHFEELLSSCDADIGELTTALINLTVNGLVQETGGNYYALAGM